MPKASDVSLFKRILVTTDFSDVADRGVKLALELAAHHDADLVLCHVVELATRATPLYAHYAPVEQLTHVEQERVHARQHKQLEALVPEAHRARTQIVLVQGQVADEILATADQHKIELIVIATHGKTGLLERFLGGVAERVVRHAKCPVLVTR